MAPHEFLHNNFKIQCAIEALGNLYRPVLEDKDSWKAKAREAYMAWETSNIRLNTRVPILFEARTCMKFLPIQCLTFADNQIGIAECLGSYTVFQVMLRLDHVWMGR